jgi:hypothetical protein
MLWEGKLVLIVEVRVDAEHDRLDPHGDRVAGSFVQSSSVAISFCSLSLDSPIAKLRRGGMTVITRLG